MSKDPKGQDGPRIAIQRPGNVTSSAVPNDKQLAEIAALRASGTEELRAELEKIARELKDLILRQPPTQLLAFLWSQLLLFELQQFKKEKRSRQEEEGARIPIFFALEYVHAALSSFPPPPNPGPKLDEKAAHQIVEMSAQLHERSMMYALVGTDPRAQGEFGELSGDVQFAAKSNWVMIRGHRYQVLEEEFFQYVLAPHDDVLTEVYGCSANQVAAGLQASVNAMRLGASNAIEAIGNGQRKAEEFARAKNVSVARALQELEGVAPAELESIKGAVEDLFDAGICNVSKHSGLPDKLLGDIAYDRGNATQFFEPGALSGTPFRTLPARIKPLVKIGDSYYAADPNFLRDSFYRALQRAVIARSPRYKEEWNSRQRALTERAFLDILKKQLQGAKVFQEVYFKDPATEEWVESDTLILFEDVLFVVEAKAGISTLASPESDINSHFRAIRNLVVKAYDQCKRFVGYLGSAPEVSIYERRGGEYREIASLVRQSFRMIFPIGLTVESFTPFSAMCKELPGMVPILGKWPFVSMSVDDLFVLGRFLRNGGELIHYLEVRQQLAGLPEAKLYDEIDHLGAYLERNRFDEDVRDQIRQGASIAIWDEFSGIVDSYFYRDRFRTESPPRQKMPQLFQSLLDVLDARRPSSWLIADQALRNLSGEARESVSQAVKGLLPSLRRYETRSFHLAVGSDVFSFWILRSGVAQDAAMVREKGQAAALATDRERILSFSVFFPSASEIPDDVQFEIVPLVDRTSPEFLGVRGEADAMASKVKEIARPTESRRRARPNDPCHCGSGRKFKKCHGKQ